MAENWLLDVQKYAGDADAGVVQKIVNYLGIALRSRDSSLVSFSDSKEVGRVRENYLRKKLGLADTDERLNAGLDWVRDLMSVDRTKNRVTVYYLLAHYFGKLDLFGGQAGTSAASLGNSSPGTGAAAIAGLGAAGATVASANLAPDSVTPLRSEPIPTAGATNSSEDEAASQASSSRQRSAGGSTLGQPASPSRPAYAANLSDDRGGSGWPKWLTWLLVAIAVLALFFILRSCMAEKENAASNIRATAPASTSEVNTAVNANASTEDAQAGAAMAVPTGAGVVSGERGGKPMLTVYFDTGKSDVSRDMVTAVAAMKTYLAAHPQSKLSVSGYNDPSGNAALNAELSKKRAQAVAAGLTSAGIPEASVELVKPAETTTSTVTPEQARRVEVTVKQ